MQATILAGAALFAVLCNGQGQITVDGAAQSRALSDLNNFVSTLATNAALSNALNAIATATIPDSVYSQATANPQSFVANLATATTNPAWITALPSTALNAVSSILAPADKADDDIYSLVAAPQATSLFLNSAVPASIKSAYSSDPEGFAVSIATGTEADTWVTNLPFSAQSAIGSVFNQVYSTIAADLESKVPVAPTATTKGVFPSGSSSARRTCQTCPTCPTSAVTVVVTVTAGSSSSSSSSVLSSRPGSVTASSGLTTKPTSKATVASTGFVVPTSPRPSARPSSSAANGISSGVKPFNGTATGGPVAFTGAAVPRHAAMGAAVVVAGAGALLNL